MAADPNAYLASLGIPAQGGYAQPDDPLASAQFATPGADSSLAEATVLARLKDPGSTGMQRIAGGFGAKTGKAPASKIGAFADGAMTGFSGAIGSKKSSLDEQTKRMNLLKTLFGMDRQAKNDAAMQKYRQDALGLSRERNGIYAGKGTKDDPLKREGEMTKLLQPYKQVLDDDDAEKVPSRKLSPEKRAEAQKAYDDYKKHLETLSPSPVTSAPGPAPTPGPMPTPQPNPGPPIPIPGAPAPGPAPTPPMPPMPAPGPAPTAPQPPARPPEPPKMTREQLIPAAIEKMKQTPGLSVDQVIQGAKEKFGVELTPQDLGVPQTPAPAAPGPGAQPDPNAMPTFGAGADAGGIQGILQSLFA
jgi:hypothetical protein